MTIRSEVFNFTNVPRSKKVMLAAGSKQLVAIEAQNKDKQYGFVERLEMGPELYAGQCLTYVEKGWCSIMIMNTNVHPVEITVPPVEIQDFVELPIPERSIKMREKERKERSDKLNEFINLDHLNEEKRKKIWGLIK